MRGGKGGREGRARGGGRRGDRGMAGEGRYLDAVDADPGRHQGQYSSHQVNELCGLVVTVQPLLPQLI